ncbi:MAG TPA: DNA-binding response regulator [Bacteroidales bacterium]|nr:MAG: DNA-binding response regulator [Bacteroidetes bacterium GWF2_33_38]OFY74903.1 MAG: DNA-binding response regulator [Bacteroidetes bacterium RIFOXYA12_FULL_33_9]OFY90448.1 MAG: DNA-binding response regulator [Bacteroidetes bacterium RIFOXYA2_FULL_33_7]HBF88530.1 DNA-binding response regulator [Bacteroidales bacterium]
MIRTIAIDDEPLALQLVEEYIKKTPFLNFQGTFDNPLSAMEFIDQSTVDLIFLDIKMPDLSGTEFARTLDNATKIVFTTAFDSYAIEGFKLHAVDYLLKPFEYDEFLIAAKKAKKIIDLENKVGNEIEADADFIFLKSDYKIKRINLNDITYIEGLKDYIKVYVKNDNKPILSISSMKAIEQKLSETKFMRVHRSFIVNLDSVKIIDRSRIVIGNIYIPISEQYKDKFLAFLSKNTL